MSDKYDVIVVGMGPSSIFCAYELIQLKKHEKVLLIDQGKRVEQRNCPIEKTKKCITIEDGTIIGGLGSAIKELISEENLKDIQIKSFAYPDKFIEHGSIEELEAKYGLDVDTICAYIEGMI